MDRPARDPRLDRLVDAALALAAEIGWPQVSLADIAGRAELSLAETFALVPDRGAVLDGFLDRIDDRMLASVAPDLAEPARDRLFEVIMGRFDALAPYREGFGAILRALPADPLAALAMVPGLWRRLSCILEAAGLASTGPIGALRVQGLAIVYVQALRVWATDDSPDLATTMAALDRSLRRIDPVARRLDTFFGMAKKTGLETATIGSTEAVNDGSVGRANTPSS